MNEVGYILATLVGISLGLIGGGGSILTVPILVYIMGIDPILAASYSLFIVGVTSLVGSVKKAYEKNVDLKTAVLFGTTSFIVVYITRTLILPVIPASIITIGSYELTKSIALMILFAIVMIMASVSMIRSNIAREIIVSRDQTHRHVMILLQGSLVGLLTGLLGAGGGFLIIPALVIMGNIPMKKAIGTSLLIISVNSLIGFSGDVINKHPHNWSLLLIFTSFAIIGMFIGTLMSRKISGEQLKKGFGWFVLVMGIYIIFKELLTQQ